MKVLIAYDGSPCSRLALEDLTNAGMPESGVEAMILSVGEYVPVEAIVSPIMNEAYPTVASLEGYREISDVSQVSATRLAVEAEDRLKALFPHWSISHETSVDSAASAILEVARDIDADLIVMGSHGRAALSRVFLGSVSLRVVSEAPCSVRITKHEAREHRHTILLAFDGSQCSRAALHAIMHRSWPEAIHIHIVTAVDLALIGSLDFVTITNDEMRPAHGGRESRLEHDVHAVLHELKKRFKHVTSTIKDGSPTEVILTEAELIQPDTIFMGAHGYSRFERLLLGSVGRGIAVHSSYTVEIVRHKHPESAH